MRRTHPRGMYYTTTNQVVHTNMVIHSKYPPLLDQLQYRRGCSGASSKPEAQTLSAVVP